MRAARLWPPSIFHLRDRTMQQQNQSPRCGTALSWIAASLLLICLFSTNVPAQEPPFPESVHYLTDYAEVISDVESKKVERVLFALEQRTQIEFRVVIIPSIGGIKAPAYADKIFRDWRIGAKSGKGILLLFVTRERAWEFRTTNDFSASVPPDRLRNLCQESANEIEKSGYEAGVPFGVESIVGELGSKYGFTYAELAQEDNGIPEAPPPRPPNPPSPVTLWTLVKLAFGVAISGMGVMVGFGLGLGFLNSLFSWKYKTIGSQLMTILKKAASFAVVAGLLYYFWNDVQFYLNFGHLLVEGVATFGALLFPIFALVAFIVLVYLLKKSGQIWARYIQAGKQFSNKSLIITLCLPFLLLVLPRSEASILHSWEQKTGLLSQIDNAAPGLFGLSRSSYVIDDLGRVRALVLRRAPIHSLKELAGIEKLTLLERLDVEGVPLEGVLDVSALTSLKVLRVSQTQVAGILGIENVQGLEELEIDRVNLDAIGNLERLPKLKRLTLTNCFIPDLTRLASFRNLEALYLDGTNVTDLTALSELRKLSELSIAETAVEDLRPIQQLPLFVLNIRDTSISKEQLHRTFKHSLIIVYGKLGVQDGVWKLEERFVPPEFKIMRNRMLAGLAGLALLLSLLWSVSRLRTYSFFLLRKVFSQTVWGVVLVVILLNLASIKLPVYVISDVVFPDISRALMNWAAFVAIIWLGIRPLLVLSLETKYLNASAWSVPAQWAVRCIPIIALFAPVSYTMISNAVPATLNFINVIGFLITFVMFGVLWIIGLLFLLVSVRNWQQKLRNLKKVASVNRGSIVEIPLRSSIRNILFGGVNIIQLSLHNETGSAIQIAQRPVITAASAAMLFRMPEACADGVTASVITLQQRDLLRLRRWEIRLIRRWVEAIYYHTWSPIWLMSDWLETLHPNSAVVRRNLASLDSLLPCLSGTEHRFKIAATVFPLNSSESVQKCLATNETISVQELKARRFDELLDTAFTPVAVLLRSVFGYAELADRLDVLMRATEIAIAFFSLALTAEYELEREHFSATDRERVDRGLNWTFKKPPMFADWVTLLSTFAKCGQTELGLKIRQALDESPAPESLELRTMLETAAGAEAVRVGNIKSRRQIMTLLNHVRNLLIAHGPVIERASLELYRLVMIVTLDLLAALPWSQVSVCDFEEKRGIAFQGLQPQATALPNVKRMSGIYVRLGKGDRERFFEAHKYFHNLNGSIAMFIGEEGFFEPLTGLRV